MQKSATGEEKWQDMLSFGLKGQIIEKTLIKDKYINICRF